LSLPSEQQIEVTDIANVEIKETTATPVTSLIEKGMHTTLLEIDKGVNTIDLEIIED
jgi:hypothetical protein